MTAHAQRHRDHPRGIGVWLAERHGVHPVLVVKRLQRIGLLVMHPEPDSVGREQRSGVFGHESREADRFEHAPDGHADLMESLENAGWHLIRRIRSRHWRIHLEAGATPLSTGSNKS